MGVQEIYQTLFPSVLGKTKVFYRPRSFTSGNITLWSFPIPREKYFDLLPALPLNNCIIFPSPACNKCIILNDFESAIYAFGITMYIITHFA